MLDVYPLCVYMALLFLWKRSAKKTEKEQRRRQVSRARSERDAAALSQSHTVGCQWFLWGRGLRVRSASPQSCATNETATGSTPAQEGQVRSPSPRTLRGQPSCGLLPEVQKYQVWRHGSFCSEGSYTRAPGPAETCPKHSSLPSGRYEGANCWASPQERPSNSL